MNDFTNTTDRNTDNTEWNLTSADLRNTSRNWAIGATVAAVVAIIGIGAAVTVGSDGGDDAAVAATTPTVATETIDTVTDTNDGDTNDGAADSTDDSSAEAADTAAADAPAPVEPETTTPVAPANATEAPKQAANEGPCPTYRATNNLPLQLCDSGEWVTEVQTLLSTWNDIDVDGHFGPQTERAVLNMQSQLGFDQNGLVTQELLDVIVKLDPACEPNGAMCDQPEAFDDADHEQEGPHGDHLDGGYSYDDYCNDVLFDATHAPGHVDVDPQAVADCVEWFSI